MNVVGMIHLAPMKLASASWSEDTLPSSQLSLAAMDGSVFQRNGCSICRSKPRFGGERYLDGWSARKHWRAFQLDSMCSVWSDQVLRI